MALVLGVDLGTTTITALALDTADGAIAASATMANAAALPAAPGRSEWDAPQIAAQAFRALRDVAGQLGARRAEIAGICLTGQQHGMLLLDAAGEPLTPFINWQDRRGEEPCAVGGRSVLQEALSLAGPDAPRRNGCTLSNGFLGVTLFWLKQAGMLPARGTACFLGDYLGALLTGQPPVTDPTNAASSGLLNLQSRCWDSPLLAALGLPEGFFPPIREAGEPWGTLTAAAARETELPQGLPVHVGLGDNQASFLGSVADLRGSVLVNVGTGAQVACYAEEPAYAPPAEARPFPRQGYLLVHAGLCGGRAYAILERFFRQAGAQLYDREPESLYARLNALAAQAPAGADGLRCEPFFAGSREDPERRGVWRGISEQNFTPAHFTRALLEGMARSFRESAALLQQANGNAPYQALIGAGNGVRKNPAFAAILSDAFAMPLRLPRRQEEAAYGAALMAGVGAGIFPDMAAAGRLIRYA